MAPDQPQLLAVALACARRGDFKAMSDICRHILSADPEQPDALHCMGLLQRRIGDIETSIRSHERAVRGRPANAEYLNALGLAYRAAGRIADAIDSYESAIRCDADFVDAYVNLGQVHLERGDHRNAIGRFREAVERRPSEPPMHVAMGRALAASGDRAAAMDAFQRAIAIAPATGSAWAAIGALHAASGEEAAAMTAYGEGIARDPKEPGNYLRLAPILHVLEHFDDALDCLRRGVGAIPGSTALHVALARLLLRNGHWKEAWPHYERRLLRPPHSIEMRKFVQPQWDGRDPAGMTICVHCEPNTGESLVLLRYLAPLAERGARIVLRCPPALRHLLSGLGESIAVRGSDEPLPPFERQAWLSSLPLLLQQYDPADLPPMPAGFGTGKPMQRWSERCADLPRPLVGVHWRNPSARALDDPLALLHMLAPIDGSLIALQDRTARDEIERAGLIERVTQVGVELEAGGDIVANIAAAAAQCDLVITVDSAIAQIAAMLGRPTIVLVGGAEDFWWPVSQVEAPWFEALYLHRRGRGESEDTYLGRLVTLLSD